MSKDFIDLQSLNKITSKKVVDFKIPNQEQIEDFSKVVDLKIPDFEASKREWVVVLTGAGISEESGIQTYRDDGGLWRYLDPTKVASEESWRKNPQLVLDLMNARKIKIEKAQPNKGHLALVELEKDYDVLILTQNIDNLHEKAGSSQVYHHGSLSRMRSSKNPELTYPWDKGSIKIGDLAEDGSQLRPDVVLFGENVPMIGIATFMCLLANIFVVIGSSLTVHPAATLVQNTQFYIPKYIINPIIPKHIDSKSNFHLIRKKATQGVPLVVNEILSRNK